ncbi:hypothetical protein [Catenovulum maritimum]|uniref:hypothetical protein n=1 Tax=Catenovulum maritimum TaxID=1513271 RepID=UPI0012B5A761|nr:hypothetical protein [Catenovulum maritimum]
MQNIVFKQIKYFGGIIWCYELTLKQRRISSDGSDKWDSGYNKTQSLLDDWALLQG